MEERAKKKRRMEMNEKKEKEEKERKRMLFVKLMKSAKENDARTAQSCVDDERHKDDIINMQEEDYEYSLKVSCLCLCLQM